MATTKKAKTPVERKSAEHAGQQAAETQTVVIKGKPLSTRGRRFTGKVMSAKMAKTVTVQWERRYFVPKYQRYEKRYSKVTAHDETGAKPGDTVEIVETRPISKTKKFLVVKKTSA